jgi:hypothetical protein
VLLEELEVGLRSVVRRSDLLFGRGAESGRLYVCRKLRSAIRLEVVCPVQHATALERRRRLTLADSLLCVHLGTILHLVDGEVDLGDLLLLPHRTNGIVEVDLWVGTGAFHVWQVWNA